MPIKVCMPKRLNTRHHHYAMPLLLLAKSHTFSFVAGLYCLSFRMFPCWPIYQHHRARYILLSAMECISQGTNVGQPSPGWELNHCQKSKACRRVVRIGRLFSVACRSTTPDWTWSGSYLSIAPHLAIAIESIIKQIFTTLVCDCGVHSGLILPINQQDLASQSQGSAGARYRQ